MNARPHRTLRRELESQLRDVPTPTPPDDLLAKIRAEIPHDLAAANGDQPSSPGSGSARRRFVSTPAFRLAASIAVAVVGVGLTIRLASDREEKAATAVLLPSPPVRSAPEAKGVQIETRPIESATPGASKDERPSLKGEDEEAGRHASETKDQSPTDDLQRLRKQARAEMRNLQSEIGSEPQAITLPAPEAQAQRTPAGQRHSADAMPRLSASAAATAPAPAAPPPPTETELLRRAAEQVQRLRSAPESAQAAPRASAQAKPKSEPSLRDSRARQDADKLSSLGYVGGGGEKAGESNASSSHYDFDAIEELRVTGEPKEVAPAPPADMFFRPIEKNPFVDTRDDRLSTFGLDVDTGSWSLTRSYLDRGLLPPAEAIRAEEFVNAQTYDDPAPRRGDFTLIGEGAPSPFAPGDQYRLLRFAVQARELHAGDRKPANLTFVVDVSGSMSQENRLGLVKRALGLLLSELRGDDRVALVVYGSQGRVLLRHTRDHEAIRDAIARLVPDGSTNAEEGLRLGYDLAGEVWRKDAINRVILCSDGVANVGATGPESILGRIGSEARRGIELTTVGFGMGNYNDALMEQLADQGDGAYHYVDTLDEARRIFVENLTGTLQTVAKDAKVQVEFDPRVVERWRLIGYENRDVADRDFRNDAVDAGEIGVGHSAVALYEVRLAEGVRNSDPLGTMRLRWKSRASKQVEEASLRLEVGDLEGSFRSASNALRTAAVAAELAERLARSYWAQEGSWELLSRIADRLDERANHRIDRTGGSLADTVRRAARLAGSDPLEPQRRPQTPAEERDEY